MTHLPSGPTVYLLAQVVQLAALQAWQLVPQAFVHSTHLLVAASVKGGAGAQPGTVDRSPSVRKRLQHNHAASNPQDCSKLSIRLNTCETAPARSHLHPSIVWWGKQAPHTSWWLQGRRGRSVP